MNGLRRYHEPRPTAAPKSTPAVPLPLGALRDPALRVFAWSRAAVWAYAVLCIFWLSSSKLGRGRDYIDIWSQWDGQWFMRIAHDGYATDPSSAPAFFPLYPGLLAIGGRVLGGRYDVAGVLISLLACAVAFILLRKLAELETGRDDAGRAVLYLALFPLTLYLIAVYSESVYLALALAAFLAARHGRWTLAALAAGGCCLTRPTGIAVVAALIVLALRARPRRSALAWVVASPLALLVFPLLLQLETGRPSAILHAQATWHRQLSAAGPFGGIWSGARAAWHGLALTGNGPTNVEYMLWLVVFLGLTTLVWKWLGPAYGVFAALSLALPLSYPETNQYPLASISRFGLVIVPFYLVLARLGRHPRWHSAIVGVSVLLLALYIARFSLGIWVA